MCVRSMQTVGRAPWRQVARWLFAGTVIVCTQECASCARNEERYSQTKHTQNKTHIHERESRIARDTEIAKILFFLFLFFFLFLLLLLLLLLLFSAIGSTSMAAAPFVAAAGITDQ